MSDRPVTNESGASVDAETRTGLRQWLDRWEAVGPLLDQERWERLRASSEADLRQQALDVLSLWQPGVAGDDGAALVSQQHLFGRMPAETTP